MDEFHEPVKNADVTVNTDIDVIYAFLVAQILLKVLHTINKEILLALEVLVHLFVFITDVNDNHHSTIRKLRI